MSEKRKAAYHVEAQQDRELLAENLTINAAIDITKKEHDLGVLAAMRLHPMAVFWSAFFCIAGRLTQLNDRFGHHKCVKLIVQSNYEWL